MPFNKFWNWTGLIFRNFNPGFHKYLTCSSCNDNPIVSLPHCFSLLLTGGGFFLLPHPFPTLPIWKAFVTLSIASQISFVVTTSIITDHRSYDLHPYENPTNTNPNHSATMHHQSHQSFSQDPHGDDGTVPTSLQAMPAMPIPSRSPLIVPSVHTPLQPRLSAVASPTTSPSRMPLKRSRDVTFQHDRMPPAAPRLNPSAAPGSPASAQLGVLSGGVRRPRMRATKRPRTALATPASPFDLHCGPEPSPGRTRKGVTPALPDEVLVSIFRFVPTAGALARLRGVCRQWCRIIDSTPHVWRHTSFRHASFSRRVERAHDVKSATPRLRLGCTPGARAVAIAARAGNEWARFLHRVMFCFDTLHAFTAEQPLASLLVSGRVARTERAYPPWATWRGDLDFGDVIEAGGWIAVHAARHAPGNVPVQQEVVVEGVTCRMDKGEDWPCGALVGLIHVVRAVRLGGGAGQHPRYLWQIDRAVSLKKPLYCAGFVGLWSMSRILTDLLIDAMHRQ